MKHKRILAMAAALAMVCGEISGYMPIEPTTASVTAYAAEMSYTDRIISGHENVEIPYDNSSYIAAKKSQISEYPPEDSPTKPTISISKNEVPVSKAGDEITVNVAVSGADKKYGAGGIHFYYDDRLISVPIPFKDRTEYVVFNVDEFYILSSNLEKGCLFSTFSCTEDYGEDRDDVWQMKFKIPEDAEVGDLYPIGIDYQYNYVAEDCFTNASDNKNGKMMQNWVFTQGIENGYIKIIEDDPSSTTASEDDASDQLSIKKLDLKATNVAYIGGGYYEVIQAKHNTEWSGEPWYDDRKVAVVDKDGKIILPFKTTLMDYSYSDGIFSLTYGDAYHSFEFFSGDSTEPTFYGQLTEDDEAMLKEVYGSYALDPTFYDEQGNELFSAIAATPMRDGKAIIAEWEEKAGTFEREILYDEETGESSVNWKHDENADAYVWKIVDKDKNELFRFPTAANITELGGMHDWDYGGEPTVLDIYNKNSERIGHIRVNGVLNKYGLFQIGIINENIIGYSTRFFTYKNKLTDENLVFNEYPTDSDSSFQDVVSFRTSFIDTEGNIIIDDLGTGTFYNFSNDLVAFYDNNGFGYIDNTGKIVIPAIYSYVSAFNEYGVALVVKDGIWQYINKNGDMILELPGDTSEYSTYGGNGELFTLVHTSYIPDGDFYSLENKCGVIDKNGDTVLPMEYDDISTITDNTCLAVKNGKVYSITFDNKASGSENVNTGDANCDDEINMADAVMIMQSISNPDKYQLTENGRENADVDGSGDVTNKDALFIQQYKLGLIKTLS